MNEMELNPEEAIDLHLQRLQRLWTFFLLLPLAYLGLCVLIDRIYLQPRHPDGLWPSSVDSFQTWLTVCAIAVGITQIVLLVILRQFKRRLYNSRGSIDTFIKTLTWRQWISASCCDTVSFIGLVLFLLNADLRMMLIFGMASYLFYAQIHPFSGLGEIFIQKSGGDS